jgi:hypothetical protein
MDYQEEYEIEDKHVRSDLLLQFYNTSEEGLFELIGKMKEDP